MNQKFNVCAVMVCFHPNLEELSSNIISIVRQVEKLIIVDNTDKPVSNAFLTEEHQVNKIEWISLNKNLGIGAAHNVGIKIAVEQNYEGVLLLDQDSKPPEALVSELVSGVSFLKNQGIKIACIGPEIINKNTNESYKPLINKGQELHQDYIEKDVLISSGKLIVTDSIKEIGLMDEALFIDLVDFEWCWRAKKLGYRIFSSRKIKMGHMVGSKNVKIFNFYTLLIPAPIRHYYQFRNNLLLLKRGYVPFKWKIKSVVERCIELLIYPWFVAPRLKRVNYIFRGIFDGIIGRKGKINNV